MRRLVLLSVRGLGLSSGLSVLGLVLFLYNVAENVVEHKVAIGLTGEYECLREFLVWL